MKVKVVWVRCVRACLLGLMSGLALLSGVASDAHDVRSSPQVERLAFATYLIPMHVESEAEGLFVDLMKEVARQAGFQDVRIDITSAPRALRNFKTGLADALFPALDVFFDAHPNMVRTAEPIDCKEDFVFTRRGGPLWRTLDELRGKRVGITQGYPYSREVMAAPGFTLDRSSSDELGLRKLAAGRIDAFVLDEKTGIQTAQALGLRDVIQYDARAPVSRQDVYVAFQATPAGRAWAQRTSQALQRLKAQGRYQHITNGVTFGRGCVPR